MFEEKNLNRVVQWKLKYFLNEVLVLLAMEKQWWGTEHHLQGLCVQAPPFYSVEVTGQFSFWIEYSIGFARNIYCILERILLSSTPNHTHYYYIIHNAGI